MRYLFVGDSAHAELKSSALLGKFDTFALPFFDDAAFELVKRTDERQHKFRDAGDVLPVLKAQTFFHKLERNTAMRQFLRPKRRKLARLRSRQSSLQQTVVSPY